MNLSYASGLSISRKTYLFGHHPTVLVEGHSGRKPETVLYAATQSLTLSLLKKTVGDHRKESQKRKTWIRLLCRKISSSLDSTPLLPPVLPLLRFVIIIITSSSPVSSSLPPVEDRLLLLLLLSLYASTMAIAVAKFQLFPVLMLPWPTLCRFVIFSL